MTKKLTWVLAHEPYDLFLRAASSFATTIKEETNGRYEIDVIGLDEFNRMQDSIQLTTHANDREKVVGLVESGAIDMATVYVNTLGQLDHNMWALSMPFLFSDHEHAESVLDGRIGQQLFDGLSRKSNVQGLSFTYSGGFRIIPSVQSIESVRDFYNLTLRTGKNPVALDTFRALGANPVGMLIDEFRSALENGTVTAGETTYPRFFTMGHDQCARYINHTEHSLFLTGIVTNKILWDSLSTDDKVIFREAAIAAAQIERKESLADIERVQKQAYLQGIETVTMTRAEKSRWAQETSQLYTKYQTYFDNDILNDIRKIH